MKNYLKSVSAIIVVITSFTTGCELSSAEITPYPLQASKTETISAATANGTPFPNQPTPDFVTFAPTIGIQLSLPYTPTTTTIATSTEESSFQTTSQHNILPPAQYLVFPGTKEGIYEIISIDGVIKSQFDSGIYSGLASFSRDTKKMVFFFFKDTKMYIFDWVENILTQVPVKMICYNPTWSPDGTMILASCSDSRRNLYLINPANGVATLLDVSPESSDISGIVAGNPEWSPDGKWIAFGQKLGDRDVRKGDGIVIVDATCLLVTDSCEKKTLGPFFSSAIENEMDFDLSWSPDSKYLAVNSHLDQEIRIVDIDKATEQILVRSGTLGYILGVEWSPDGEWIAFSRYGGDEDSWLNILLISPWSGELKYLTPGGSVTDWITVIHPVIIGNKYILTEAGSNLNLRVSPSLDSQVVRKIQPGKILTVLDGPVDADGYFWWKLQTDDGLEGWAVNIPEWYSPIGDNITPAPKP